MNPGVDPLKPSGTPMAPTDTFVTQNLSIQRCGDLDNFNEFYSSGFELN